jgi:signal transduction histidine kinase
MRLAMAPFRVADVVAEATRVLAIEASAKGLRFIRRCEPDMPVLVGDAGRLRQVLVNLTGNAIKFTERGSVTIEAGLENASVDSVALRLAVRDTGIGIAPDKTGLIFEKFTQVDGSMTRRFGGTGLGLAIVRQLVELMGGSVGVDSTVGVGSTFWVKVRLPVAHEECAAFTAEGAIAVEKR